jgi:mannitol-specific phosphotransferase system IIBC component
VTVRLPWTVTVERLFRPGAYDVTATATSTSGQVSAKTDSRTVHVIGRSLFLNGRPVATISVATPLGVLFLSLLALIIAVIVRLVLAVIMMHRREHIVEEELETLREVNKRQSLTKQQLDDALEQIEEDVEGGGAPAQRKVQRRRAKKRSR